MSSKEQKKFKKRKDRQKIAKSKILRRREIALEESRKEKALLKEKYKIKQLDEKEMHNKIKENLKELELIEKKMQDEEAERDRYIKTQEENKKRIVKKVLAF